MSGLFHNHTQSVKHFLFCLDFLREIWFYLLSLRTVPNPRETSVNYATVCSGIGAPEQAFSALGWTCQFCAEIEPFPSAVHAERFPGVPNLGDITKFKDWPDYAIDLIVAGTPCPSFSVAGLRKGMADPRGNLALTFLAIISRYRPRWVVWENVPGVLSSSEGRDFGAFLGGLGQLGYGFAYRVLDAQYFGVPQRRRRVFVVGHSGGLWQRAAAVLFEPSCLRGDPAPRREKREDVAPTISARTKGGGGLGTDFDCDGGLIARETAHALCGHMAKGGDPTTDNYVAHSLRADGFDASEDGTGRGTPIVPTLTGNGDGHTGFRDEHGLVADTVRSHPGPGSNSVGAITLAIRGRGDSSDLETRNDGTANAILTPNGGRGGVGVGAVAIPFDTTQITSKGNYSNPKDGDDCHPLAAGAHPPAIAGMAVRRLTPRECCRLQGFSDDFTAIEFRGKPAADGNRYKALGNSIAVPVLRWLGERIEQVSKI